MSEKKRKSNGWIAFDFDRTLAVRNSGDNIFKLGAPIPKGIELMKRCVAAGRKVKVLTARSESQWSKLTAWLEKQGIPGVEVTNKKDSRMDILFDDKGCGLVENEGISHMDLLDQAALLLTKSWVPEEEAKDWIKVYQRARASYDKNLSV
jgi:hypothetical protein